MKFTVLKDELLKALIRTENVALKKSTLEILKNVCIEVRENYIEISATDFKVGVRTRVNAVVDDNGEVTINAKVLTDIVNSYPGGSELEFKSDKTKSVTGDTIIVSSVTEKVNAVFKINGLSRDDYPVVKSYEFEGSFKVDQILLKNLIKSTIHSVSKDESRLYLNGLCFIKNGKNITLVGTDGRRLAVSSLELEEDNGSDFKEIVPNKVLHELYKVLEKEGTLNINVKENEIMFYVDGITYVSNLIEGQFPDYKKVIPNKLEYAVKVETDKMIEAITRVSKIIDRNCKHVVPRVILEFKNNELHLTSSDEEYGTSEDVVSIEGDVSNASDVQIGMNYNFLIDVLRSIENYKTEIKFTGGDNPIQVNGEGEEDTLAIIMPMKIE